MINFIKALHKKLFLSIAQYAKETKQEHLIICLFILGIGIIFGNLAGILFTIALIVFSIWRPELTLVLLFFSGFLKNIEVLQKLPIDLSLLAVLLLIISSSIKIIKIKKIKKLKFIDYLVLFQGLLVLFSVIFISSGTELNWWDGGRFIVFNLSLYFGLFSLSVEEKEIITIIQWILIGIIVTISSAVHNLLFGKISSWYLSSFGESYSILGLMIGLGMLYFFHNIFRLDRESAQKTFSIMLFALSAFLFGFIPTRHVPFSLALTFLFIILLKNLLKHRWRLIGVIFLSLAFYLAGLFIASNQDVNVKRVWTYKGDYAGSFKDRADFSKGALELIKENPIFGIGMGEFMYLHGGKGNYPHNLLLESLVSFGIFGLLIFWPVFFLSLKNSYVILKSKNLINFEIIAIWFIFFFLDSNFSGSLSNFRTLWLFMGILSILFYSKKILYSKARNN